MSCSLLILLVHKYKTHGLSRWTALLGLWARKLSICFPIQLPVLCACVSRSMHTVLVLLSYTVHFNIAFIHKYMYFIVANINHSLLSLAFQFTQSCPTLCDPMDCSTPSLPVHHQLPESTQTHVHWVCDAIQPSQLLLSCSPPTFNLSQHQGLFKWVSSSHHVAKVLEFQLQHQSFQWIFRTDFP